MSKNILSDSEIETEIRKALRFDYGMKPDEARHAAELASRRIAVAQYMKEYEAKLEDKK